MSNYWGTPGPKQGDTRQWNGNGQVFDNGSWRNNYQAAPVGPSNSNMVWDSQRGWHDPVAEANNPNAPQNQTSTVSPTSGVSTPGNTVNTAPAAIRAQTERTLQLLRGTGQQGVQQGMQGLRQNLAQRGLMDSGSLGAGASRISNNYGNLMAQGTMNAANNETDKILGLQQQEAARQHDLQMQQINASSQRSLAELMARLQRENQPTGWQQFASGAGQGVASALPAYLMSL